MAANPAVFYQVSLTVHWYPFILLFPNVQHNTKTRPGLDAGPLDPVSSTPPRDPKMNYTLHENYNTLTFPSGSGMRKSAATMDDLPAPVLPAIPIFSLSAIDRLMSLST